MQEGYTLAIIAMVTVISLAIIAMVTVISLATIGFVLDEAEANLAISPGAAATDGASGFAALDRAGNYTGKIKSILIYMIYVNKTSIFQYFMTCQIR